MKNRRPARESRDSSQRPATPASDAQHPARAGQFASTHASDDSVDGVEDDARPSDPHDESPDESPDESFDDPEFDGPDLDDAVNSALEEGVFEGRAFEAGDDAPRARARKNDERTGAHGFNSADSDEFDGEPGSQLVRLNKYLASHGVASRRGCDVLITEGGVMVDDEIVTDLGVKIDPAVQRIEVDGVVLKPDGVRHRYYLLNKPSGVVCTNSERELRPRAVDLITDRDKGRLFTVGRLDEETTGLIILTNDGDFANRVMHPRYGVNKTYEVRVLGLVDDEAVQRIRDGVYLSEGITAGARVVVLRRAVSHTKLLVTIQEGKNREVRRVFARFGHKVSTLKRIRIGSISDRGIKTGSWRPLKRAEIEGLLNGLSEEDVQKERRNKKRHGRTGGVRRARPNGGDRGGGRDRRGSGDPRLATQRVASRNAGDDGRRDSRTKVGAARGADRGAARTVRTSSDRSVVRKDQGEARVQRRVIGGDAARTSARVGGRDGGRERGRDRDRDDGPIVGREAYTRVDRAEKSGGGRSGDERRGARTGGRTGARSGGREERSTGTPRFGPNRSTSGQRSERSASGSGGSVRGSHDTHTTRGSNERRGGTHERTGRAASGERRDSGTRKDAGTNVGRSSRDTRSSGGERTSRTGKRRGPETIVSPSGRRVIS